MNTSVDFYNRGSIKVTKSVFEVGTKQFQIRNISETDVASVPPDRKGPIIMCVIGGICLLSGQPMPILLGLACIGGGIWWWISQKSIYTIMLKTSSGESTKSYASHDLSEIREIREALNAAMH
jgi:Family of unknown function (DUF6232)